MNSIKLLTDGIDSLWWWTYGIIAGWGLTVTLIVAALVLVAIRTINLQRRIQMVESRIINAEREFNLSTKTWPGKNQ
jgi:hypothetical protein